VGSVVQAWCRVENVDRRTSAESVELVGRIGSILLPIIDKMLAELRKNYPEIALLSSLKVLEYSACR
jgi:hypothetical protein